MKTIISVILVFVGATGALAQSVTLVDKNGIKADLKYLSSDSSDFGIDFDINKSGVLGGKAAGATSAGFWSLKSKGFTALDNKDLSHNSIVSEASLLYLWNVVQSSSGAAPVKPGGVPPSPSIPLSVGPAVFVKHEASQDFKDYDIATGAEIGLNVEAFGQMVNTLLRSVGLQRNDANQGSRALDVAFGYEYLSAMDETDQKALRLGDDETSRYYVAFEFGTQLFNDQFLELRYTIMNEISAPAAIKAAGKDRNRFFEATFKHPLPIKVGGKSWVFFKYTSGELPPNFKGQSTVGGGLQITY